MLLCQIFNFKNMVRTIINLVVFYNVKITNNYDFYNKDNYSLSWINNIIKLNIIVKSTKMYS
jgi:hypothetical protein